MAKTGEDPASLFKKEQHLHDTCASPKLDRFPQKLLLLAQGRCEPV